MKYNGIYEEFRENIENILFNIIVEYLVIYYKIEFINI